MFYLHAHNILSKNKCSELISLAENLGFEAANVRFYKGTKKMENVRNNSRIEFSDPILSSYLESSLLNNLSNNFPFTFHHPKLMKDVNYVKLNPSLRFYKYTPGEYFKPHKDGGYKQGENESLVTVLFYLNDTQGGETVLMPDGAGKPENFIHIKPKAGDILLFNHNAWHEGRPVQDGVKYVLRTDLFYTT